MTAARQNILNRLKTSLNRSTADRLTPAQLEAKLASPAPGIIPKRARLPFPERIDLFEKMALDVSASIDRVDSENDIPNAVSTFLKAHDLPQRLVTAPDESISGLSWQEAGIQTRAGIARKDDPVSVTPAFAGVAETGSLMVLSGPSHPSTLNLLPDNHIVVLKSLRIMAGYEEAWALLKSESTLGEMPRTVLFITGPSRSADIGFVLQLGAHGPRRLHVILIDDLPK